MPQHVFVYVVRSSALAVREDNVRKLESLLAAGSPGFPGVRFTVTRVTAYDPGEITSDLIKNVVDVTAASELPEAFRALAKPMHVNQLSNNLKHFAALRMALDAAAANPDAAFLVVEDDVLFNDDVATMLLQTLAAAAEKQPAYDLIFLGLPSTVAGTPQDVRFEPSKRVFNILPCCDSYLVSPACLERLTKAYLPVRFPTNVQLSYLADKLLLTSLATTPSVFIDGSKLGVFMSSIEQNNALVWNPQYNEIRRLLDAKQGFSMEEFKRLLASAHFKEHPDFQYLAARALVAQGDYANAEKAFARAFDTYVAEKCVFGPECQFMKDYVQVFRHLQPPC
jgi:hypothetical protein